MTVDEFLNLPVMTLAESVSAGRHCHPPLVLCADGSVGMLTVLPSQGYGNCGVEVWDSEDSYRCIDYTELEHLGGGAFVQAGAPRKPKKPYSAYTVSWARRGGVIDRLQGDA